MCLKVNHYKDESFKSKLNLFFMIRLYWFCFRSLFSTCCIIIGLLDSNKNEVVKLHCQMIWIGVLIPGPTSFIPARSSYVIAFTLFLCFSLDLWLDSQIITSWVKWPQVFCTADHGHSMWNWVTEYLRNWLIFGFPMLLCYFFFFFFFFVICQFNDLLSCQRGVDIDFIFVKFIVNQSVLLQN